MKSDVQRYNPPGSIAALCCHPPLHKGGLGMIGMLRRDSPLKLHSISSHESTNQNKSLLYVRRGGSSQISTNHSLPLQREVACRKTSTNLSLPQQSEVTCCKTSTSLSLPCARGGAGKAKRCRRRGCLLRHVNLRTRKSYKLWMLDRQIPFRGTFSLYNFYHISQTFPAV